MRTSSPDQWYSEIRSFDWRGHQIVYKESLSNRSTLLLIHGFPTASYDWSKIWESLSKKFSLLAPDMIGFGHSAKPKSYPYSIMRQADLIMDLLKESGIRECHLLAHDYGDTVAQELLARSNHDGAVKYKSVCLLNGGIFPESHHPLLIQKLLMSPIGFVLSKLLTKRKFERSFSKIFGPDTQLDKEELTDYWNLISHDNGHRIAHNIIRYMRERKTHRARWVGALQEYDGSLGLINGPLDPISGHVMVDRYKSIISDKNIWLLDGIGHYPQVEAPDQLLSCYYDFIEKV